MQTAIVTGGAGFIGQNLCTSLLEDSYRVICIDNFISSSPKNVDPLKENSNFTFLEYDVINPLPNDLEADYIFHLASPASPNHHSKVGYLAHPLETMLVNTAGTLELLKFAVNKQAKFLFTSTSEIYGDPLEHPQKEDYRGNVSTTGPRSVYDEAKRFGETICSFFSREKGADVRIARLFNTYGPGMIKEDRRMIVDFINQALSGQPITVFGDGVQTRSLCFVEDTVNGLKKMMFTEKAKGEIINIGSTFEHSVKEYAEMIKKMTNSDSEIIFSEELPEDDPLRRQPDISKAKKLLNWEPKISLEDGLAKTIEYFKNQQ